MRRAELGHDWLRDTPTLSMLKTFCNGASVSSTLTLSNKCHAVTGWAKAEGLCFWQHWLSRTEPSRKTGSGVTGVLTHLEIRRVVLMWLSAIWRRALCRSRLFLKCDYPTKKASIRSVNMSCTCNWLFANVFVFTSFSRDEFHLLVVDWTDSCVRCCQRQTDKPGDSQHEFADVWAAPRSSYYVS